MHLINVSVWCGLHSAVLTFPRSVPWSRCWNRQITSTLLPDLQFEVSHRSITAHSPPQRLRSTSERPQKHVPVHVRGLGRPTQRPDQQSITQLSHSSQHCLQIAFLLSRWFFFSPSHICSVAAWTGFHWLPRCDLIEWGTMYLWGRMGLYAAYQTDTQHALESHGEAWVSGREGNPAQHSTTEIPRYSVQQHRWALLQQLRSSAELIWI